jgi:hypothetical protein
MALLAILAYIQVPTALPMLFGSWRKRHTDVILKKNINIYIIKV